MALFSWFDLERIIMSLYLVPICGFLPILCSIYVSGGYLLHS
jgi:hypothetical protein